MSLKDALTEHANILRSKTGVSNSLSISDMTRLLDDLSWNKKNLLKGTSDEYKVAYASPINHASTASNNSLLYNLNGVTLTYSLTLFNTTSQPVGIEIIQYDDNYRWLSSQHSSMMCSPNTESFLTVTCLVSNSDTKYVAVDASINDKSNRSVKIKDERLYEGTEPGIWTPNPSDLTGGQN